MQATGCIWKNNIYFVPQCFNFYKMFLSWHHDNPDVFSIMIEEHIN